jgi:hypothetical protein
MYDYVLGGKDNYAADRAAVEAWTTTRSSLPTPALLTSHEAGATEYIDAVLRDTPAILDQAAQLLDFTKPVAVTLLAIVPVIPDSDDPHAIVAKVMDAVPSGSHLAISHSGTDLFDQETGDSFRGVVNQMMRQHYTPRSREQVTRFFAGMDLVEPGKPRISLNRTSINYTSINYV